MRNKLIRIMRKSPIIAIILLVLCVVMSLGYTLILFSIELPSLANIKAINCEIYEDLNATQLLTEINWGIIEPNETKTFMLFIKSTSTVNITLSLATANWHPANCTLYIDLTWNYMMEELEPLSITPIELYLHIADNITGIDNFSFDIIISAMG